MGSLQKVKHLTTSCAVSGSTTRSPSASPVVHLRRRRRKTLRMLLDHSDDRRQFRSNSPEVKFAAGHEDSQMERAGSSLRSRRKLKDLFVSSSPPLEGTESPSDNGGDTEIGERLVTGTAATPEISSVLRRRYTGSLRPSVGPFRYRLLRRAWRPALVPIPE
ncbi:uncharacterized protein LOC116208587 [Punica granatum]|uniref:Uncharacterized protein n=2 Tax=Punica granatum TaxID=22663 RepID=A0A218VWG3_PUNGR|nr:uncharacterized protein LOC116208587 [Punica granatum]OWM64420.1 hypothetical protein CDL15_Pgr020387 [Punica granatum]PKI32201.1 hypothetical protein CRG98_047410 [Punica granatum]